MSTLRESPVHLADAPSDPERCPEATRGLLADVALAFSAPVLPDDPFPDRITGRKSPTAERLATWVDETRAAAESLAERLRQRPDDASVQESARLRRLAREWRVFEAFRQLHESSRCPNALFRLRTKADLLTLCDRDADSSSAGYGERQRRVLSKRGISHRHTWAEARRVVAEVGLLDDDPSGETTTAMSGDGLATAEDAVVMTVGTAPDDGSAGSPTAQSEAPTAKARDCDLPEVRLDAVWTLLPGLTKAKLAAVVERFGVGLWAQFGDRFYSSMRKAEMLEHARRVVRHHACLDAAQRLTARQVDDLDDWMRGRLGQSAANSGSYQKDSDLRIAARLFDDFQASAALSAAGSGLSPDAWNTFRDADLRRIAAFCYHRFYGDRQS
ncbi:hypothetical protein RQM47_16495 [Rubrivirga sp. S365]|uniref:hypothetical protein n=1 Tax=Rubrivirga sp. S365 TaxID=3076080 RepID=UPI0028C6F1CF|nr:hypothetical protein [Rubrivirga sp. S365]MDT7858250.1 hypothetical protein [Rubrivirga sp. S365]